MGHYENEAYLAYIREKACIYCASPGPSDPDHVRNRGWREPRRNDFAVLPTCRRCHNIRHAVGWIPFLEAKRMKVGVLLELQASFIVEFFAKTHIEVAL